MANQLLTVRDVMVYLNVCRRTVYRLIHSGRLIAHRIGKDYRIRPEDFEIYMHRVRTDHVWYESKRPGSTICQAAPNLSGVRINHRHNKHSLLLSSSQRYGQNQ